jgi:hypothetical protein
MFSWTTTTLINELPFIGEEMNGKALRIGKHLFEKRWVENIRKAEGKTVELCEVNLDLTKVKKAITDNEATKNASVARLYIYVGLEGSEESIYANDWYRKGMPLSVSFNITDDATEMASAIANTVKTFNVFTKVKKVLDVAVAEAGVLNIKGTHEHQRIEKVQVLVEVGAGEEKAVVDYELRPRTTRKEDAVTLVKAGRNGFGTYSQLLKDLRLPTAVHNHWLSVQKDEMPVVGALYTQYIITYYAPSTANPSFTALGNRSMSETTHVFWVNMAAPAVDKDGNPSTVGAEWEKVLAYIDPNGGTLSDTPVYKDATAYSNKKKSLVERVEALEN